MCAVIKTVIAAVDYKAREPLAVDLVGIPLGGAFACILNNVSVTDEAEVVEVDHQGLSLQLSKEPYVKLGISS